MSLDAPSLARLAEIREAARKCPDAWDPKGRPLMKPQQIMLNGPSAIRHRRELLGLVDVLLEQLQLRENILL